MLSFLSWFYMTTFIIKKMEIPNMIACAIAVHAFGAHDLKLPLNPKGECKGLFQKCAAFCGCAANS